MDSGTSGPACANSVLLRETWRFIAAVYLCGLRLSWRCSALGLRLMTHKTGNSARTPYQPPAWQEAGSLNHILGTTRLTRYAVALDRGRALFFLWGRVVSIAASGGSYA